MLYRNVCVRVVTAAVLSWCATQAVRVSAQQIGRTPVEVRVPQPPTAASALGRVHLVYEIHLTNFGATGVGFEKLDVLDAERTVLASWSGQALWQRVRVAGQTPGEVAAPQTLPGGAHAIAYLWLSLPRGQSGPASLVHRATFSHVGGESDTVVTAAAPVAAATTSIAAPVLGGPWVAVRGPSNASPHRLSLVTLGGRARVPQRFAVDWALLGADGLLYRGDPSSLANWYGYDAPVYATAKGIVVKVRDGRADRPPMSTTPPPAVMDADEATGNVVVIDLGRGRFATYAHLKAGSLRVVEGDTVVEGQPIARIGNSGNSLGPHLHFQIGDAAESLGSEGLPFSLQNFALEGRVSSFPALLAGTPWTPDPAQPGRMVSHEMPLENMVIHVGGLEVRR
jgi:murein DD-endopeptidase